jgi:hypothetical protein
MAFSAALVKITAMQVRNGPSSANQINIVHAACCSGLPPELCAATNDAIKISNRGTLPNEAGVTECLPRRIGKTGFPLRPRNGRLICRRRDGLKRRLARHGRGTK